MKKLIFLATIIVATVTQPIYAKKLIFASELIRHGERTATRNLPGFVQEDPASLGQLTAKGIQQEYNLGKRAKERYIKTYKLLSPSYDVGATYARSSDFDRTLMSANAFLIGMYSNCKKVQPFAIHSTPLANDTLLVAYEVYKKIVHGIASEDPAVMQYLESSGSMLKKWRELFKMELSTLEDLIATGDTIYIRKKLNLPLPNNLPAEDIEKFNIFRERIVGVMFQQRKLGALTTIDLMKDIEANINKIINDKDAKKFVLYSAHDVTILGLMSALGVPLEANPPYASNINIMLFEDERDSKAEDAREAQNAEQRLKNYHLEFLYNEKPLTIPDCDNKAYCTLAEFKSMVTKLDSMAQSVRAANT